MLKKRYLRYAGFTLIEMMFIVLLAAFVMLQIAQTQQQKAEANLVEHTAGTMDDWILAIINFYNQNNGTWPDLKTLTTAPNASMPSGSLCSQFTINSTPNLDCGSYAEYTGTPESTYYVLSIQTNSANIATLVASKLQNSWISNDNMTVNTAIPAPSASTFFAHRGWIVSAGLISFSSQYIGGTPNQSSGQISTIWSYGSQIYLPNCPPGFDGHFITTPEEYDTAADDWGIHLAETKQDGKSTRDLSILGNHSVVFSKGTDQYNQPAYAITTNDVPDDNSVDQRKIRHLGFYMTFCLPQGTAPPVWSTNYVDSKWTQDGQCSYANGTNFSGLSWETYLRNNGNNSPDCRNTTAGSFVHNTLLGQPTAY